VEEVRVETNGEVMNNAIDFIIAVGAIFTIVWTLSTDNNYDRYEWSNAKQRESTRQNAQRQQADTEARPYYAVAGAGTAK
jgi:large-conductance mechanosensitive channel